MVEPPPAPPRTPGSGARALRRFGLFMLAAVLLGLAAGYVFARTSPRQAAGALVADSVRDEPVDDSVRSAPPGAAAPTSGAARGAAACGRRATPVDAATQVASLAAGVVVVQYRPDRVDRASLDPLERIVRERPDQVLLAPNPRLRDPVVATAWGRRLALAGPRERFLRAFVTAYGGLGPEPSGC